MIIRTRRKNESLIQRIFGRAAKQKFSPQVLSEEQFEHELAKEVFRSDRRVTRRRFGLIRVVLKNLEDTDSIELDTDLLNELRKRLRISDSVGWYQSNLGFLLPETEKEGTLCCANDIAEITAKHGLEVDTEVSMYPDDDELISVADELKGDDNDPDQTHPPINPPHADWSKSSNSDSVDKNGEKSPVHSNGEDSSSRVKMTKHSFVRAYKTPVWKRGIDIVGAGMGLLMLSPLFLVTAIGIKLTSKNSEPW